MDYTSLMVRTACSRYYRAIPFVVLAMLIGRFVVAAAVRATTDTFP
jgi:hypothetical protein